MEKKQKLDINEIPQDVREKILSVLRSTEDYRNLVKKQSRELMIGNPIKAMELGHKIAKREQATLEKYLEQCEWEIKSFEKLQEDMPRKDAHLLNVYSIALIMLSDLIETFIIEANQILKKTHPIFTLEMFDKLNELGKEARRHVSMLDSYAKDKFYTNTYGDTVDKLFEMIRNKSKSFLGNLEKHAEKEKLKEMKQTEHA